MRTFLATLTLLGVLLGARTSVQPALSAVSQDEVQQALTSLQEQRLPIATKQLYLQDKRRQKTLPVRITYPEGVGPFPVIIFSHGMFGSRDGYTYLARYWAEHGYVCIQPSHEDSLTWMHEQGQHPSVPAMLHAVSRAKDAWIERAGDISFIIDSLPLTAELSGKLDPSKVGVAGHSYGAFTSIIIAGAQLPHPELAPNVATVKDPRVKAIIAMSPQEVRQKENSLAFDSQRSFTIDIPALFMTGDRDQTGFSTAEMRGDAFKYCPPGDKYFVSIFGANHMTFSGRAVDDPKNAENAGAAMFDRMAARSMSPSYGDDGAHRNLIETATTLYWDAYLKGDQAERAMLQQSGLATVLGKAAVVHSK